MRPEQRGFARKRISIVGILAAGALAAGLLTSCSDDEQVPSIGYLIDNPITTYNGNTIDGAYSGAAQAFPRVLTGMSYIGPQGDPVANPDFGTANEVPGGEANVLTIQYRLNNAAVYSDGVPTSCEDLVLAWAALSGKFTKADDEGRLVPMFNAGARPGYSDIERVDCQPGSKDATVVFRPGRKFVDWKSLFSATEVMPAHIATQAAGVGSIATVVQSGDNEAVGKVADFWNNGWKLKPNEIDPSVFVSSGPYRVESFSESGELVLVENDKWWGAKPATPRIVVFGKGADVLDEIDSGAVDVIDIGANSVADLPLDGLKATNMPSRSTEQLVLGTGGVFASADMRKALALCSPRQKLYDDVGHPDYKPEAGLGSGVLNSRIVSQDSLMYGPASVEGGKYPGADVPAAQGAVAASGAQAPTVRIGYLAPDERRAETVKAIADACGPAGIKVEDVSSPTFAPTALLEGQVDAVLGGTASVSGPAGSMLNGPSLSALRSGSATNYGRFTNPRYDQIVDQLLTDPATQAQLNLSVEAEALLWSEMPSIPLFDVPRTVAFADGLDAGIANPTRSGAGWNMDRWVLHS
ncbi:ABC transporter substrate-binding protein [Antrihabitans sp. YC2-6]|uniref:ABC transporter substrate-binding protein n=1 Tax=Antrihabitans sp. YC2-6 TaxID=2799498 RepID=UPI0018F5F835|nr:ABC transporter substrate-binding protein [Antrihabitans sp. YC2-6]MBJ8345263.1 peptide-binding protein [Antrihabitans sp. YC2-6]